MTEREWNAQRYHAVSNPQFEWGARVLDRLELAGDEVVLDAGCGTGRLTTLLAERLPHGAVIGLDRSTNMARLARDTVRSAGLPFGVVVAELPELPFSRSLDVVFSTATFHWVLDHPALFVNIRAVLRDGGRLHAQCGGAGNLERIHRRATALITEPHVAPVFVDWRTPWEFASVETTVARLEAAGFTSARAWLEPAPTTFDNAQTFGDFITTVVLRPFLARLSDDTARAEFVARIIEQAAHDDPAFTLDYWRLNIEARR